jgi:hypothetical protein
METSLEADPPRVLVFSGRNIYEQEVWRCAIREFERILPEIDAVDIAAPAPRPWYRNGKRLALRLGEHFRPSFNPGITPVKLEKEYDLLFTVIEKPSGLLHLNSLQGWKDRCKTSCCLVTEFYERDIPMFKSCLELLAQFDYVFFMFAANEQFQRIIGGRGRYTAAGIDALRFCPYPRAPRRTIDVLSIGRRSEKTHRALLRMAQEDDLFYVYDTISDLHGYNLEEHRLLTANMAKRSRYFIVNPGKIDAPEETGGLSEFGYRYFEGAAAGSVLIGEIPRNREFGKIFHWKDAVIHVPYDSEEIADVIRDFDRQPERQKQARRKNILECLSHHDWVYRWETILNAAGLSPLPALYKRKERLQDRCAVVEEQFYELTHTGQ